MKVQKRAEVKQKKTEERKKPILEHSLGMDKYKCQFDESNDVVFQKYPVLDVHALMYSIPDA